MITVRDFLSDQKILRSSDAQSRPSVSVVLPTYARCRNGMLRRSIASVLAQTFEDFELLIIDDGSIDGSFDLIEEFRDNDPRVVHVRHERNSGIHSVRLNEGIELARGQFLAFQFDDDCWKQNALQALTSEADHHSEPVVVVGHARFKGTNREWTLPVVDLNPVTLYEQNRFANNAVLFPRSFVQQYGMYDCHIGARRLCDWDLWLRYIKHVPFVCVNDLISEVYESNPGSLGLTVPWDLPLFRFIYDIPRNHLLTPNHWHDYVVDSLRIGDVDIPKGIARRLFDDQILPYYLTFRHFFPNLEMDMNFKRSRTKSVLYTKNSYDVSNDVTLQHYDPLTSRRGTYKAHFEPLSQVTSNWINENDALLLVRTVEDKALDLLEQARGSQIPTGLYLDDDLLTFHQFGPAFDYLAPGTPYYRNLCEIAKHVDTVWVTTRSIENTVKNLNPRIIPHNNSIPLALLPDGIRKRNSGLPLRIGYVGSGYRLEEFTSLWDAIRRVSQKYGDQVLFEFWGVDLRSLPKLDSPVSQRPFVFSYFYYLSQLQAAGFDILMTPLFDTPTPRLGKSLIKYYETAVAGALGIFSDVPQYRALPADLTCLKAENSPDSWYKEICRAIEMPSDEFNLIRKRALEHVREEYTETAQINLHEAAWRATELHGKTRQRRHADGRPRVVYVLHSAHFGGGEMQLWRRLWLARQYGIEPVVVLPRILQDTEAAKRMTESLRKEWIQVEFVEYTCFDHPRRPTEFFSELERNQVRELLEGCSPALVHTVTFIPSFGQICGEMRIPHVSSLYAIDDAFAWTYGQPNFSHCAIVQSDSLRYANRWGQLLGAEKCCAREVVPEEVFTLGLRKHLEDLERPLADRSKPPRLVVTGTLQERKRQLETIEAAGRLKQQGLNFKLDIYGYTHFFPEYLNQCKERIQTYSLENRVRFCGFNDNLVEILSSADVVLSLSTFESFPSAIKEAMAAGVLVVATPVGGIPELVIDGVSGILCADASVESITDAIRRALSLTPADRKRIVEQARRVARSEFHPHRAVSDLLTIYNRAIDLTRPLATITPESAVKLSDSQVQPPSPEVEPPSLQTEPPVHEVKPPAEQAELLVPQADSRDHFVEPPASSPLSHLLMNDRTTYRIIPRHQNWMGLDVLVGTHQQPASGKLNLGICSITGYPLRQTEVDLSEARDNEWLQIRFSPIANSASVPFILKFSLIDAGPETRISFYEDNPREEGLRRLLRLGGLRLSGNELHCRMLYDGGS